MAAHSGPKISKKDLAFAIDAESAIGTKSDTNILSPYPFKIGTGSETFYGQNGDGNSRIMDTNPFGVKAIVWDGSNNDASSNADGGWNSSLFPINQNKMYRFSCWIRRKVKGNGSTYLGAYGYSASGSNIGVRWRTSTGTTTNPYGSARGWPDAGGDEWTLWVFHVWPYGTGTGDAHPDSGIWRTNGTKRLTENRDMVWLNGTTQAVHRTYLYYSTNSSTNQQWWHPRVDLCDGDEPTIDELIKGVGGTSLDITSIAEASTTSGLVGKRKVYRKTDTASKSRKSAFVFGSSDNDKSMRIPLAGNLNKLEGTISCWVKPNGYSGSNGIFVNRDDPTANALDWLWIGMWSSGGIFYFRLGDGSGCCNNDLTFSSASSSIPTGQWTHVTVTWRARGKSKVYINGKLKASRTIGNVPTTNPSSYGRIGLGHASGSTGSWDGEIANFRIQRRQSSDKEVYRTHRALSGRFR